MPYPDYNLYIGTADERVARLFYGKDAEGYINGYNKNNRSIRIQEVDPTGRVNANDDNANNQKFAKDSLRRFKFDVMLLSRLESEQASSDSLPLIEISEQEFSSLKSGLRPSNTRYFEKNSHYENDEDIKNNITTGYFSNDEKIVATFREFRDTSGAITKREFNYYDQEFIKDKFKIDESLAPDKQQQLNDIKAKFLENIYFPKVKDIATSGKTEIKLNDDEIAAFLRLDNYELKYHVSKSPFLEGKVTKGNDEIATIAKNVNGTYLYYDSENQREVEKLLKFVRENAEKAPKLSSKEKTVILSANDQWDKFTKVLEKYKEDGISFKHDIDSGLLTWERRNTGAFDNKKLIDTGEFAKYSIVNTTDYKLTYREDEAGIIAGIITQVTGFDPNTPYRGVDRPNSKNLRADRVFYKQIIGETSRREAEIYLKMLNADGEVDLNDIYQDGKILSTTKDYEKSQERLKVATKIAEDLFNITFHNKNPNNLEPVDFKTYKPEDLIKLNFKKNDCTLIVEDVQGKNPPETNHYLFDPEGNIVLSFTERTIQTTSSTGVN
ncbi:MAG: hypothetical protein WCJ33_02480, partial [Pseudomonadota bacterium]